MGASRALLESILASIKLAHVSRPRSDGQRACVPAPKSSLSDPKSLRAGSWALTEPTCTPPRPSSTGTQMGAHTNVLPRAGHPASPADPLRSKEQPGHSPAALTSSEEALTPAPGVPDNTQARGSQPRRPGVPRACPHAAARPGAECARSLSPWTRRDKAIASTPNPLVPRAWRAGTQLGEEETEAGGTGARQKAVGQIQEGLDGNWMRTGKGGGSRETRRGPDSRPERSWQEKGVEEPWGWGTPSGPGSHWGPGDRGPGGGGSSPAGRPLTLLQPSCLPRCAFLACPADFRCQRPPGTQGAPPHLAFCLYLASTPQGPVVQRCDPRDAQNIHQESRPSPGHPEDLQSPGEGCGSGENVYKKPRQDWTEPRQAAASRTPALGAEVSTHSVRDHRSPPAVPTG